MIPDTLIPIKVKLEQTNMNEMKVLYIKDTAPTTEGIKDVLGRGYGELMQCIGQHQLKPNKFMVWYYATKPPWPVEVAVETDRIPAELDGRIQSKIQPGGEVIVAHMWGPFDQAGQAYGQIGKWLKENKRKAKGAPFEVYLNDPATVKDPSEIRTDIYQPIE